MRWCAKFAAVVAGWSVMLGGLTVSADEPQACPCPQVGVPMLGKLPYLSRLFKSVGVVHEPACETGQCDKTPAAEQLERIGVDFERSQVCPDCPVVRVGSIELAICAEGEDCCCRGKECHAVCTEAHCPAAHHAVSHNVASCEAAACAAKCDNAKHTAAPCCAAKCCEREGRGAAAHAATSVHHAAACQCAGRDELWEHLVKMAAKKGAAEAALEARQEHSELLDALVEMATQGAALEAKLEAQAEHHKLMERMLELASENAQLKARAELAEAKAAMLKETIPVAVERELLARRVAELEERLAAHDTRTSEVRTAKKAAAKKAR